MQGIKTALDAFQVDNGHYPKQACRIGHSTDDTTNWHGPYLDKLPVDPWGQQIYLRVSRQA